MNPATIGLCWAFAALLTGAAPLGAAVWNWNPEQGQTRVAKRELKRMKAERYFTDQMQADLVAAIGRGDLESAQRLLRQGADVNAVGREGMTPIYWALLKQNFSGLQFLLAQGATPGTVTRWPDAKGVEQWASALEFAAISEDARYLRALLDAGADPNQIINASQQTALYYALLNRRFKNAQLLIDEGADINHRSKSKMTPIGTAVYQSAYATALFLLRAGADPQARNRSGMSAVDATKKYGDRGVAIGSEDDRAYPEFVNELKRRGLWDE